MPRKLKGRIMPELSDIEAKVLALRENFIDGGTSYDHVIKALISYNLTHPVAVAIADSWDEEWEKEFDKDAKVIPIITRNEKPRP